MGSFFEIRLHHKKGKKSFLFCFSPRPGLGRKYSIKKAIQNEQLKVPRMGVEPTRPNGHMALNHACLPIPAPRWVMLLETKKSS